MKTVNEWIDKTNEIADELEKQATKKYEDEINRAQAYVQGYHEAIEYYARKMRNEIRNSEEYIRSDAVKMKIIDRVLNKEFATEEVKEYLLRHCCVKGFGFKGDCEDDSGMCRICWNKESEVSSNDL